MKELEKIIELLRENPKPVLTRADLADVIEVALNSKTEKAKGKLKKK